VIACGGGGGSAPAAGGGEGDTGTVAVLISDGPEDFDKLWISVTEVSLIPGNGRPVVVFHKPGGYEVDLLAYQDEDFLLKLTRVPAGYYEKVRLKVRHVEAEGGDSPCSDDGFEIKLPSGKIDLVDRGGGGFRVRPGQVLAISLDVDVPKSINLHQAGNSGKCIFRPVVFVDIEELQAQRPCPYFLTGEIASLDDSDPPAGFTLHNDRGDFEIVFSDDPGTEFFGADGASTDNSVVTPGEPVGVFGRLLPGGRIEALAVVVGSVALKRGIVQTPESNGSFGLQPPGEEVLEVGVTDPGTIITTGCRAADRVDLDAIQPGFRAKVMGVWTPGNTVSDPDQFVAVVVFLKREFRGHLVGITVIEPDTLRLTIAYGPDQSTEIDLPADTPIYLEGDGVIALEDLQERVGCGSLESLRVRVILPLDAADPASAPDVLVRPDRLSGTVVDVDLYARCLWVRNADGITKVYVRYGAFILLDVGGYDLPVSFYDILIGDTLTVFGLEACVSPPEFDAYIVLAE
jgi:hypothetical protein